MRLPLISTIAPTLKDKKNWLCFFAGLSLVLAYAPFSYWWLTPLALTVWLSQLDIDSSKKAIQRGFFFGLGWFSSGISWVHVSIADFGGMPLIVSLALMLLLCLYLAIFPAIATYIASRISLSKYLKKPQHNSQQDPQTAEFNLWLIPVAWIFTEWLRGWFLTGFPWLSLGYSQIDSPLASLAPVIGEMGITLVLMLAAVSITLLIQQRQIKQAIVSLSMIVILTVTSNQFSWVEATGEHKKVALVQGNIAQALKWQPDQEWPTMLKYLDLTRKNYDADIVVWPESAIPAVEALSGEYLDMVNQATALNELAVITGIINYNFEAKQYFNSLIVLGKQHQDDTKGSYFYPNSNRFNKHHLLPIGEFVPFQEWLRPIAPFFNLPMSSFTRGAYIQNNLEANGVKLAPLICFEIAFPAQLHANFYDDTDMLLTVSNDAWFGTSHGPHQHMEIARMRALEFGRPLLRSTNTGITAVVDHNGKFIARIPQFEEAVLKTDVALVSGYTPFSRYQNYPVYFFSALLFIGLMLKRRND